MVDIVGVVVTCLAIIVLVWWMIADSGRLPHRCWKCGKAIDGCISPDTPMSGRCSACGKSLGRKEA